MINIYKLASWRETEEIIIPREEGLNMEETAEVISCLGWFVWAWEFHFAKKRSKPFRQVYRASDSSGFTYLQVITMRLRAPFSGLSDPKHPNSLIPPQVLCLSVPHWNTFSILLHWHPPHSSCPHYPLLPSVFSLTWQWDNSKSQQESELSESSVLVSLFPRRSVSFSTSFLLPEFPSIS